MKGGKSRCAFKDPENEQPHIFLEEVTWVCTEAKLGLKQRKTPSK